MKRATLTVKSCGKYRQVWIDNPYCLVDDWFLRFNARWFRELEKNCQIHEVNLMIITEIVCTYVGGL